MLPWQGRVNAQRLATTIGSLQAWSLESMPRKQKNKQKNRHLCICFLVHARLRTFAVISSCCFFFLHACLHMASAHLSRFWPLAPLATACHRVAESGGAGLGPLRAPGPAGEQRLCSAALRLARGPSSGRVSGVGGVASGCLNELEAWGGGDLPQMTPGD